MAKFARLRRSTPSQPETLTIAPAHSPAERQAEAAAQAAMMHWPGQSAAHRTPAPARVRRNEQRQPYLQRYVVTDNLSRQTPAGFTSQWRHARAGGQPIPARWREPLEDALGGSFRQVRLHHDSRADQLNQAVQARAFTTGRHIFFRRGAYRPDTPSGRHLLAHELAHVQQRAQMVAPVVQRWPLAMDNAPAVADLLALEQRLETTSSRDEAGPFLTALLGNGTIPEQERQVAHHLVTEALRPAPENWNQKRALWKYSRGRELIWTPHMVEQVRPAGQSGLPALPHDNNQPKIQKIARKNGWKVPKGFSGMVDQVFAALEQGILPEEQQAFAFYTGKQFRPVLLFTSQLKYMGGAQGQPDVSVQVGFNSGAITTTISPQMEGGNSRNGKEDIILVNDGLPNENQFVEGDNWQDYIKYVKANHGNPPIRGWLYSKHGDAWRAREQGPTLDRLKSLLIHEATHARFQDYQLLADNDGNDLRKGVARFLTEFRAYLVGKDWQPPQASEFGSFVKLDAKNVPAAENARRATAKGLVNHIFNVEDDVNKIRDTQKTKLNAMLTAFLPIYFQSKQLDFAAAWKTI